VKFVKEFAKYQDIGDVDFFGNAMRGGGAPFGAPAESGMIRKESRAITMKDLLIYRFNC
jgi:hypothetical protein